MGSSFDEALHDANDDKNTGLLTVIKREDSNDDSLSPDRILEELGEETKSKTADKPSSTRVSQNEKSKSKTRKGKKVKISIEQEEVFDPSAYRFKKPDYNY